MLELCARLGSTNWWCQCGVATFFAWSCAGSAQNLGAPCDFFYQALEPVPRVSLTRNAGSFQWIWDDEEYEGCQIEFESNDSTLAGAAVPDFFAEPGSDVYREGWRMSQGIGADGAGSGIHGIERGTVRCLIRWEQPAYIDDDGEMIVSETLRMWIQCRK